VLNCPYKKNITIFCYEGEFLIAHIFKKNKLKRMNIIFSTHKTSNKIFKLILLWSKKNHIDYLSYIENKINTSSNFLSPKKNDSQQLWICLRKASGVFSPKKTQMK
jgi:hypothetical protein